MSSVTPSSRNPLRGAVEVLPVSLLRCWSSFPFDMPISHIKLTFVIILLHGASSLGSIILLCAEITSYKQQNLTDKQAQQKGTSNLFLNR